MVQGRDVTNYSYDVRNRLLEATNPDGTWQANTYDAEGLRASVLENGKWFGFTNDRGSVVTETAADGKLVSRDIRGIGLIAQEDNKGTLSYYLHNAHGDVTSLVNGNGDILNSYQNDAFGSTTNYAEKVANRFMYAGEQFDKVTGDYYLRARYYDPVVGRFTQEDTYRGDGLNLYAFVANNSLRFLDKLFPYRYETFQG